MIPLRPFKTFANKTGWQFGQVHRSRKSTMDWTVLLCFDSAVADFCLSTAWSNKFCVLANWVKNTMNVQCDPRWSWTIPAASWNALSLVSPFLWRSKRLAIPTLALNLKKHRFIVQTIEIPLKHPRCKAHLDPSKSFEMNHDIFF